MSIHLTTTITNDTFFKDTDGNYIYSQGGCIQKFGDKYYWYGVKYKEADIYAKNPENGKAGNAAYETFTCYSSDDLVNWKFEVILLPVNRMVGLAEWVLFIMKTRKNMC